MGEMGKRIRMKRTEKGMTMEQLASALGVKASAINKYEKGIVENIKRSTIKEMAIILECDPAWLMGFDSVEQDSNEPVTPSEQELLNIYKDLDEDSKRQVLLMIAFLKEHQDKK